MTTDSVAIASPAAARAEAPALSLDGITAGYGSTTVLRNINLVVPAGKIVALIGPNGAGKTTLLRVASGLLRSKAGEIRLGERDVTRLEPYKRARSGLCLIPEGRGIFRTLSVRENLQLQVPAGTGGGYDSVLDIFPILRDRLRQTAGTLSGGEQQMLALARCYLVSPSIVLLDEISMGLAPRIIDELYASLVQLAQEGVSLLLVEQYVSRALEMSDTVYILDRGQISHSATPSELDEDAVINSYLGEGADELGEPSTKA